jgi:hypothetical protein
LQDKQRMLRDAAQTLTIEEAMALFIARQKATVADAPPPAGTPDGRCADDQAAFGAARGSDAARGAATGGRTAAAGGGRATAAAVGRDSVAEAAPGRAGGGGAGGVRGPFGEARLWAGALLPAPENAFKRATKLYKYIPHRLKQQDFEDSDIQLMMSGSGVALKRKDTNKMVYLTAFQFDEAARVAEATDYAHCADEHAEHVQLLKGIWDLYDSKYLQDYDAAVRDAVTRMPGSVGFMSNHTHLWKQHVEMPHMRNMISRSGADSNHMPATRYRAQGRDGPPRAAPVHGGSGGGFNVNGLGNEDFISLAPSYSETTPAFDRLVGFKMSLELLNSQTKGLALKDFIAAAEKVTGLNFKAEDRAKITSTKTLAAALMKYTSIGWTSNNHTGEMVEFSAYGPGSQLFTPHMRNDQVHAKILRATGVA